MNKFVRERMSKTTYWGRNWSFIGEARRYRMMKRKYNKILNYS